MKKYGSWHLCRSSFFFFLYMPIEQFHNNFTVQKNIPCQRAVDFLKAHSHREKAKEKAQFHLPIILWIFLLFFDHFHFCSLFHLVWIGPKTYVTLRHYM